MNQIHKEASLVGCLLICIVVAGFIAAHEMRPAPTLISETPTPETLPTPVVGTSTPKGVGAEAGSSPSARIVFAADFSSNAGCADHSDSDACDLFTSTLDLATGMVTNVAQITHTSLSESYPAWNPNGNMVYATILESPSNKWIESIDLSTTKTATFVSSGSWPTVSPDGSTFLYIAGSTDLLMRAPLVNGGLSLGTATQLTGIAQQQDPDYAPNGQAITFHEIKNQEAHGAVLDLVNRTTDYYEDRTGHCGFSGLGDFTVCDNSKGGGLFKSTYANGVLSKATLWIPDLKPSELAVYDPLFASCQGTSFNYPTFCGDDTHLLVSTSCNVGGEVTFSRLVLIDMSGTTPVYHPIGKSLAEAFGGSGTSSWTVDCLAP